MRNRLMICTAALLLASATFAWAQDKPQGNTTASTSGAIDIGGRFTSTSGDQARFERYRDLRNGANVNVLFNKETSNWTFDVRATNLGYRDGRYAANFKSRRVQFSVLFDSTPLNYSYDTRTPYTCTAGNCSLDAGLRAQVQAKTAVGVPSSIATLTSGSIYNSISKQFDLQSRRDTFAADARFSATDNLDFTFGVNTYKRSGNMPFGAAFAFSVAAELPIVVDNRETEMTVGMEWASHQGMFRVAYEHSKFDQSVPSFTFDNPNFATDYNKAPGTGYDPSGYSNGNGPATGRMAQPPTNTLDTFSWLGMVKLPGHTTANATFAMGANRQDAALIPWTTNAVIANAKVYATFPGLAALPRNTADMTVNYASGTMNLNSRPSKYVTLTARYRFNSRNDFTRRFEGIEYVRFDAVPEETGGESEPFNINRNTFDVNASFTPIPYSAVRVGYGFDKWEHTTRATDGWKDNTARVSFDTVGNQYVTLRALFEHTKRESIGLNVDDIVGSGGQPALRFYDEASRTRNRGTFIVEFTPVSTVGLNFSLASGKDDYQGADASQTFGLLNNKNTSYGVGVNFAPSAKVNLGADYARETFNSVQQSRNANPAPDASWTDPNRNWTLTNDEKVNTFSLYLNLVKALAKTDIRVGYDYSDSDQGFLHGGPRIAALSTLGTFIALPNVTNKWNHLTFDLKYLLSPKVGIGFSYWYEKFAVADFATINTAGPATLPVASLGSQTDTLRNNWLGSITTGYGNRPYTGQTGFVRVFYLF
ncbi:MAG TPA: MtrB/PioB family outer membrane beta-barrel protein [Vicinamibacterales bacterium]|jgi:MtrB/PioB family decaheme-associated outer membrane protein